MCIKRIVNRDIELPASKLVHFDHRFANRNSTWRKLIHVWRKRCAMQLAQNFFKWRRITPGPVRCGTFDPSRVTGFNNWSLIRLAVFFGCCCCATRSELSATAVLLEINSVVSQKKIRTTGVFESGACCLPSKLDNFTLPTALSRISTAIVGNIVVQNWEGMV